MLKRVKKREALKLAGHLESLGAAFCRDQEIPPTDAMLISKRREDGSTEYFFERKIDKVDLNELHDDIRLVFDFAFKKSWGPDVTDEEAEQLKSVMEKYREDYESQETK
jgi:hypothetical protein